MMFVSVEVRNKEISRQSVPEVVDIAELLTEQNYEYYKWFCQSFIKCVIGYDKWETNFCKNLLSSYVLPSDEAFAILLFENNYDCWQDMYEKNDMKTSQVLNKWTNSGNNKGSKGKTIKHNGWSIEAYKRFNELFQMITKNRTERQSLENQLKHEWIEELGSKKKKRKVEKSLILEEPEVFPCNDLPFNKTSTVPERNNNNMVGSGTDLNELLSSEDENDDLEIPV